jgi:hypothetical protein
MVDLKRVFIVDHNVVARQNESRRCNRFERLGINVRLCLPKLPIRDLLDDSSTRILISLRIGRSLGV